MASWTDKTPVFNPYVPQLPVETMAKVGMYKKQKYDEGIEKIQSSIDNVAGIDIIRDVDKEYLKTKLSQLQRKLRTVAGGDFSSTQLVNSVTGMTNSIVRDKYVTAAIQSTRADRKNLQEIAEAKKKGTGNPANTEFYYKQRKAYMDAGLQGEDGDPVVFNGFYSPFFDVDKHVRETFDALKPGGYKFDQIYQTDEDGNPLVEVVIDAKTGKPRRQYILSKKMTTLKKEGLFPERVRKTIDHIFRDPRVSQQLQISGEYAYKGMTTDDLKEMIVGNKTQRMSAYDDRKAKLIIERGITKDPEKKKKIQEDIDTLEESRGKEADLYDKLVETSMENPDYVRGSLYKEVMKDNYRSMYTSVKEESSVHSNPEFQANLELQKIAISVSQHQDDMRWKKINFDEDQRQFNVSEQNKLRAAAIKAGKGSAKYELPDPTRKPQPKGTSAAALVEDKLEHAAGIYSDAMDEMLTLTEGIVVLEDILGASYEEYKKNFGKKLDKRGIIKVMFRDAAKRVGKDPLTYKTELIGLIEEQLNKNYDELPENIKVVKQSVENAKQTLIERKNTRNRLDIDAPLPDVMKDLEPITVVYQRGEDGEPVEKVLSPQTQLDLAIVFEGSKMESEFGKQLVINAGKRLEAKGIDEVSAQELVLQLLSGGERRDPNLMRYSGAVGMGSLMTQAYETAKAKPVNIQKFSDMLMSVSDENILGDIETREEIARGIVSVNPVMGQSLVPKDPKNIKAIQKYASELIQTYKSSGINESPGFLGVANDMWRIVEGILPGNFEVVVQKDDVTGEIVPKLVVYSASSKDDGPFGELTISPDEAWNLGVDVYNIFTNPEVERVRGILDTFGVGQTTLGKIDAVSTYQGMGASAFVKSDFPWLISHPYDVKANILEQDVVGKNSVKGTQYRNYIYVKDTTGIETVYPVKAAYYSLDEAIEKLQGSKSELIESIVRQHKLDNQTE
jgi:hypothetical protein